jgi:tetratricopeptide (TPR) repeat protein
LGEEEAALKKRYTENKEAYNAYLKGLFFWNRRNELGFDNALANFREAIAIDPLYALPQVGISDTYNLIGHFGFAPPKEAFEKARAAARKALDIDESFGEAHTSMAWVHTYHDWDWESAEKEHKRALELNPKYATGHEWYAIFLMGLGRFDEAIAEAQKARELDPLSSMINAILAVVFYFRSQYDEALEHFQNTIEIDPNFAWAYTWQSLTYWGKKMRDEALDSIQKAAALAPGVAYILGYLGMNYGIAGQEEEARKVCDRLDNLAKQKYVPYNYRSWPYFSIGDTDTAFYFMDKACEEKEPDLFYSNTIPWFEKWRSHPRYKAIMEKIGFE